jgi:NADH-quinone oxidoreductase subunit J
MLDLLFYVFAAITLISALLMVVSPNAVNGAVCMIITFVSTAALFVLLEAYFLAIIQVLVYAGAVMVLFLFIIMLLDVDKDTSQLLKDKMTLAASITGFTLLVILICAAFAGGQHLPETALLPVADNPTGEGVGIPFTTSAKSFGYSLFTKYMLPFQVTGFLLLAAMIGVIVVSKRHHEN